MEQKTSLLILAGLLFMAILGCSARSNNINGDVHVSFNILESRTIIIPELAPAITDYRITFSGGSKAVDPIITDNVFIDSDLPAGSWNILVEGRASNGLVVASGSKTGVEVNKGVTTDVSIDLGSLTEGDGLINVTVDWSAANSFNVTRVAIELKKEVDSGWIIQYSSIISDITGTLANYSNTGIHSGSYILNFYLTYAGGSSPVVVTQAVQVYDNLTSTATIYRDNNDFTPEVFNGNPPSFSYYTYENENKNYGLLQPWNYNKTYNSTRDYPLVVYLHGSGGSWIAPGIFNNDDFKRKYPSFVYIPHTIEHSWDNNIEVMSRIEDLKNKYRIDINRIYLIGYSMGGSGSYLVVHDYFDYNNSGNLFAGIIRLAGKSQTKLRKEIADRTSVWLHFGLKDTLSGVRESVRGAYNYLKNYYGVTEVQTSVTIPDHPGTTYTLTKDNIEIVKKTEYDNDGHNISNFPFSDPYLLEWLFSQSLKNRP